MSPARPAQRTGILLLLASLLAPGAAAVILWLSGTLAPLDEPGIPGPDVVTRWGLPAVTAIRDLSAALTVGSLAILCWCLPAQDGSGKLPPTNDAWARLTSTTVLGAGIWAWSGLATLTLTYAQISGLRLSDPELWSSVGGFAAISEAGQYLAASSLLAVVVAAGAFVIRTTAGGGLLLILALSALWPLALTGHAAGSSNHGLAVESQALHLAGVATWVGGLTALLIIARRLDPEDLARALRRYSTLAGWCFLAVLVSGVVSAALRVSSWSDLGSVYGLILGAKVAGLTALGIAGWLQRRRLVNDMGNPPREQVRGLAVSEVVVMALTMGVGVALGKSEPPSADLESPLVGVEAVLGYPMPESLGWPEWLTAWRLDGLWALVGLAALVWYWRSAQQLRVRGGRWPRGRTVAWTVGWVLLVWATSGAPGVYGQVLFSMHMVQHMTIAAVVPVFLVLGGPVTLLLRTSPARSDGSYGPREWVLRVRHSPYVQIVSHPPVAAAIFIISLGAFYYAGGIDLSMRSHTAHLAMIAYFLTSGYLFASSVVGVDAGQVRPPLSGRIVLVLVVFVFQAALSISIMASSQILAGDWFEPIHPPWAPPLEDDQRWGASFAWVLGGSQLAIIAAALVWQTPLVRRKCK